MIPPNHQTSSSLEHSIFAWPFLSLFLLLLFAAFVRLVGSFVRERKNVGLVIHDCDVKRIVKRIMLLSIHTELPDTSEDTHADAMQRRYLATSAQLWPTTNL